MTKTILQRKKMKNLTGSPNKALDDHLAGNPKDHHNQNIAGSARARIAAKREPGNENQGRGS